MNREIKFRVWDNTIEKFLDYPCYFNHLNFNEFTCFDWWFKCDEEDTTVQQFTGLKDSKGKDIYEGDVVKALSSDNKYLSIVEWDFREGRWGFYAIRSDKMPYNYNLTYGCSGWEVVGNIFENPELLKSPTN